MLSRTKVLMGTFVTLSLEKQNRTLFRPAFNIVKDVEKSLSSYDTNATIYRLNRDKKVKLDHYTYDALLLAKKYYKKTDGYFDVAIGSITKDLYHFGEEECVATHKELQNSSTNFHKLHFNKESASIDEAIKIDLGGMGKGYGVDRVVEFLKLHKVKSARVAFSGDIRCIGECLMQIQNPFSQRPLMTFKMKDMGISTSGNYNRFVKSKKFNHLINPKTKESEQNFISITLISKLPNADLDAYATASTVMPREKAFLFLKSLDLAYVILDINRELYISKNIESYVKNLNLNYAIK